MRISDTHPEIEEIHNRLLKGASPAEKMEMLADLNASVRLLALAGLRSRFPRASEAQLHRKLAGLLLGEELASKVYGGKDDPA